MNGIAFGGGCELNILFDVVIASKGAIFSLPEGLIGAMPPLGASLGAALTSKKIARFALTGDWFSADQARHLGIVDIVVSSSQFPALIVELTGKIAALAPLSVKSIKSSLNILKQNYASHTKAAINELLLLASTDDFKNGLEAFLNHTRANWQGR